MDLNGISVPTVEDIRAAFGISDDAADTDVNVNQTDENVDEPAPAEENNEESGNNEVPDNTEKGTDSTSESESGNSEANAKAETKLSQQTKQNQAWAKMRSENAQLHKALMRTAEVLGIDPKQDPEKLAEQINSQTRAAIAKKNGTDPALLERIEALEADRAELTQIKQARRFEQELGIIKTEYGATDDDLSAFVKQIMDDQVLEHNPNLNLAHEFLARNFNAIKQRAIDEAVRAEQKRASEASGASKPGSKQGNGNTEEVSEVKTTADLGRLLSSLNTK